MAQEKNYTPVASYDQLKEAEAAIYNATTVDDIRKATRQHGSKVGYKAFCYLLTGKRKKTAVASAQPEPGDNRREKQRRRHLTTAP